MLKNKPGQINIDTSSNDYNNNIQLTKSFYPQTTNSYGDIANIYLYNNKSDKQSLMQKSQNEREPNKQTYNNLRQYKGHSNSLIQAISREYSTIQTFDIFSKNANFKVNSIEQNNQSNTVNRQYEQTQSQTIQKYPNPQQQQSQVNTFSAEQISQHERHNQKNIQSNQQNKKERQSISQSTINTSNPKIAYKQNISKKIHQSVDFSSVNFPHYSQYNSLDTINNNNISNTINQNKQNNQNSNLNNVNKLSIQTSEAHPNYSNNFTSYSATNQSAPINGTKHGIISTLNGQLKTKFIEKYSMDSKIQNQAQLKENNINLTTNLNSQQLQQNQQNINPFQLQNCSLQPNLSNINNNNVKNGDTQVNQNLNKNIHHHFTQSMPQRYSINQSPLSQQQNAQEVQSSIKAQNNNFLKLGNISHQGQNAQSLQFSNGSFNQNNGNGFKNQISNSINLKEGFQQCKQQEEQKKLSKSIQSHEIQKEIQSSHQQYLSTQQFIQQQKQAIQQQNQQQLSQQPQLFNQQSKQISQQQQNQDKFKQADHHSQQNQIQNNENIDSLQNSQNLHQQNEQQQQQQQTQQQYSQQQQQSEQSQSQKQIKKTTSLQLSQQTEQVYQNQGEQQQKQLIVQSDQNINEPIIGKSQPLPNHEQTKCSFKRNGIVKAYAANTNQGLVRNYNEDRVSIILNIMKPISRSSEQWPKCSFFGVYDGHGGINCADFLRDNLHQYVIKESSFPHNPKEALQKGFTSAEKAFLDLAESQKQLDRSGSCAIVILIVGETCYVANVGDSRAVLSGDSGQKIYTLSRDHKPTDELEQKRIISGGGKIYQSQSTQQKQGADQKIQTQLIVGPHRVYPGRLSVSRTFGDIEAKVEKYGGNPNVVISEPEIKSFKITKDHDFIVLASDGIYDKMTSKEVIQSVWDSNKDQTAENIHQQCSFSVENILRDSLNRRTLDNITVVMIAFNNYKIKLFGSKENKDKQPLEERKNFQQPVINSPESLSHENKIDHSSIINKENQTPTMSSSQNDKDFNNYVENDTVKTQNVTPTNKINSSEQSLRNKFKENYFKNGIENYLSYSANINISTFNQNKQIQSINNTQNEITNTNLSNSINSQLNKFKALDQKISDVSSKVHQYSTFDKKLTSYDR